MSIIHIKTINNEEVRVPESYLSIKCPNCNKRVSKDFIKKAYAQLGGMANKRKQGKNFYREIGLLGLAKRWNKPIEKIVKIHNKRLLKRING